MTTGRADTSQVSAALKRLVDAVSGEQLEKALMAGGLVLEAKAKSGIIRYDFIDTGATLNSTQARPANAGGTPAVQVGPTTEYAIYGELGVGQAPKPFMREAFDGGKGEAMAAVANELKGQMGG
jgi:HK97 gp10 family phage protein